MSEYGEPWRVTKDTGQPYLEGPQSREHLERVVVRVNALAGVSAEALEAGAVRALVDALRQAHDWMDDRNVDRTWVGFPCYWCQATEFEGVFAHRPLCIILQMRRALEPFAASELQLLPDPPGGAP